MKRLLLLMTAGLLLSGCIGFFFGPGFSIKNPDIFAEPPVIVKRGDAYFLQWRYGDAGFYFHPEYRIRRGSLWFSLMATSSSGSLMGRIGEIPIEGRRAVEVLKSGGAVWWGRNGEETPLVIKEQSL